MARPVPVVTFQHPDLCALIGQEFDMETLTERMPMMGGDLDGVDGEAITIEWFPDRPDLLTPEGTGRALRAFLGVAPGMPTYTVEKPQTELRVDASVADVRPFAALCFVRGVPFDDDYVQAVIDAQEKLTLAPGRKRRKIAIGIHDAAGVSGPFTYTCVGPDDKPFVPLNWDEPATPGRIMAEHPKGQEYAHLLPDDQFPVFLDGAGEVLSLPPVINANKTAVTASTTDLILDVTGTDPASVKQTIALLASGFADRGGTIEAVTVHDASGTWTSPDLRPAEHVIETDAVRQLLGIELTGDAIADCLARMGHDAEAFDNKVLVKVPAWRFDILHPVDLMEDVAIGHGFEHFPGVMPDAVTTGGALPWQAMEDKCRTNLLGLGFSEARTLTLSNEADQWGIWGAAAEPVATVRNPVLQEQTMLRVRLAPSLLRVLAANRHRSLPQRLFEVGYVVRQEDAAFRNQIRLAAVETGAKTGFSDAKGLAESLLNDLGIAGALRAADVPGFVPGRGAEIVVGDRVVGHTGELHPDTLVAFGLGAATNVLELDLSLLA